MMNRYQLPNRRPTPRRPSTATGSRSARVLGSPPRTGSVLVIVIALMGILLLAGIAFLTFASQEQFSAEYYSDAAKVTTDAITDADLLFDFALEQLIVGTSSTQSALAGNRHAIVSCLFGTDLSPYNGEGIKLGTSNVGDTFVDMNQDGTADSDQSLLLFNYSSGANSGAAPTVPLSPAPDVDYTYPDINNLFLSYNALTFDTTYAEGQVIIPSFHRPQYLRDASGNPIPGWQTAASTVRKVLRPHPEHKYASGNTRFLTSVGTNVLSNPVQPFPFIPAGSTQGVWDSVAGSISVTYNWDVDNDGDGTNEGVWLDLDYPVQTLSDGRLYMPLFSFTVTDLDALINLNVAGNFSAAIGTGAVNVQHPFGNNRFVSRSNEGVSRSEINPLWALYANPQSTEFLDAVDEDTALKQYRIFWWLNPSLPSSDFSRISMANSDWLFLNWGRAEFADQPGGSFSVPGLGDFEPQQYSPGKWGELTLLQNGIQTIPSSGINASLFPSPGIKGQDDDSDQYYGQTQADPILGVVVPSFIHPLDLLGNGVSLMDGSTGRLAQPAGLTSSPTNPSRWLYYSANYADPGNLATTFYRTYRDAGNGNLLANSVNRAIGLFDEPDEVIADKAYTSAYDTIFGPEEVAGLYLSNTDYSNIAGTSRPRTLAPFNFETNKLASAIRRQFTPYSFDRLQFGLTASSYGSSRSFWEYNGDVDGDGNLEFPPTFVSAGGIDSREPIRLPVREFLRIELNNISQTSDEQLIQGRLNPNQLLARIDSTSNGRVPFYRGLVSHPTNLPASGTPITLSDVMGADGAPGRMNFDDDNNGVPDDVSEVGYPGSDDLLPSTSAPVQEFWARRDRQLLARDIYVLLYTFGGGQDTVNYVTTDNSSNALYSNEQLEEMAQFAVNLVDARDTDNVITKFEYDKNLADGWNVDDDPATVDSSSDRAVVYGIEGQMLTFSETLIVKSEQNAASDEDITWYNDMERDRFFTFLELRNASPFSVSMTNGGWRIRRMAVGGLVPANNFQLEHRVMPRYGTVTAGGGFTIGSSDGYDTFVNGGGQTVYRASDFRVDVDGDSRFDRIAPNVTETGNPPTSTDDYPPGCDLDLVHDRDWTTNRFIITRRTGSTSEVVDATTRGAFFRDSGVGSGSTVTYVLERRANLYRGSPTTPNSTYDEDNPWIEVDRMVATVRSLNTADTGTPILTRLSNLRSRERSQPFARRSGEATHAQATPANSLGLTSNSNSPSAFTIWQPHFDRDFSSKYELMSLPLYGPKYVTTNLERSKNLDNNREQVVFNATYPTDPDWAYLSATTIEPGIELTAAKKFLRPNWVNHASTGDTNNNAARYDNRWYRIFEFLEVPTRTELTLQQAYVTPRTPGRINLNTLRHRAVLAGLIDDPDGHLDNNYLSSVAADDHDMLYDQYEGNGRDWWYDFIRARDQRDPTTNVYLPGLPTSRPFRSLSYVGSGNQSIEHTLLRRLQSDSEDLNFNGTLDPNEDLDGDSVLDARFSSPSTNYNPTPRNLFEARTYTDLGSLGGSDLVDYHTRHRLLRKIGNNSTTRSNVFVVWITVDNFEAIRLANGEIQIGDKLNAGSTGLRGFFLIDRSQAEKAFDFTTQQFDFQKFIQYRKTLQ